MRSLKSAGRRLVSAQEPGRRSSFSHLPPPSLEALQLARKRLELFISVTLRCSALSHRWMWVSTLSCRVEGGEGT